MRDSTKQSMVPEEWLTLFEKSGGEASSRYSETMEYCQRLAEITDEARLISLGRSPQGRDINCLLVGGGTDPTPASVRASGKAIVMIQNCIHAGEVDGKDASMLMLREILVTRELHHLLDSIFLIIVPILNVDGHERISPFNRPNQNGPHEMGWRTSSWNVNLNRDFMKADTPEMRALLHCWSTWLPDFMIDNHTTNGADYQYHVTYGTEAHANTAAVLCAWTAQHLMPHVTSEVERQGFIVGPYVEMAGENIADGLIAATALPRMSNGYASLQNRICLLVETHSLKPFANRVFSTKAMNRAALEYINDHPDELRRVNRQADTETLDLYAHGEEPLPLTFARNERPETINFRGVVSHTEESLVLGSAIIRYTAMPLALTVPLFHEDVIETSILLPEAYLIPQEFSSVIAVLSLHDIRSYPLERETRTTVERYRFADPEFAQRPYEGRQRVRCTVTSFMEDVVLPAGTIVVPTDQRTLRVIAHLLEPQAPDSFVSWGFFNAFFERKEYAEAFVMEPIAERMLEEDGVLRAEFELLLGGDGKFRGDPAARLEFFYRRSKFFDKAELLYPIMRLPRARRGGR